MKPVVLIILDGWGVAPTGPGNAISLAKLPFYTSLLADYPHGLLEASAEAVGLPKGEDGNTETGHMNIGAGYIVYQDLPRINLSIADGSFFSNHAFLGAIDHARKYESNIHLLGLVGSGGVHSNTEHLLALLQLLKEQSFTRVYLHLITDGRDSQPTSGAGYIKNIQQHVKTLGFGDIATVMGRYYAMDRDYRWDRTARAYQALTVGTQCQAEDPVLLMEESYKKNVTDEFINPTVICKNGKTLPRIAAKDSVIFFNFRIDRPRQLTKAFVLDDFARDANISDFDPFLVKYHKTHHAEILSAQPPFDRGQKIEHLYFVTMTEYSRNVHAAAVAFPPHIVAHPLGECIAGAGFKQLRVAESEKERFITYYLNGQHEAPFAGEDRIIIPSQKVATYDLAPAMSAVFIGETISSALINNSYDLIAANLANADMVGHTGNIAKTITACETVDAVLASVIPKVLEKNGLALITADHGNAEEMINPETGGADTEHSTFPVPLIAVSNQLKGNHQQLPKGILADIAPTILAALGLPKPATMTGRNLLELGS